MGADHCFAGTQAEAGRISKRIRTGEGGALGLRTPMKFPVKSLVRPSFWRTQRWIRACRRRLDGRISDSPRTRTIHPFDSRSCKGTKMSGPYGSTSSTGCSRQLVVLFWSPLPVFGGEGTGRGGRVAERHWNGERIRTSLVTMNPAVATQKQIPPHHKAAKGPQPNRRGMQTRRSLVRMELRNRHPRDRGERRAEVHREV